MADFYDQLNDWAESLDDLVDLSADEKAQITKAGAKAYQGGLTAITKEKHFQDKEGTIKNSKGEVIGHLADSLILNNKNIDGIKNGDSTVGFNKQHARIARLLNNGWRYESKGKIMTKVGDSFITNSREQLNDQIAQAEMAKAKEILDKK